MKRITVPERFASLAPWRTDLVRLGARGDGGYVIATSSLNESRGLISLGLAGEWSFDSDFLARHPTIRYLAADRGSGFLVFTLASIRALVSFPPRLQTSWGLIRVALRFLWLVRPFPTFSRRRFVRRWVRSRVTDNKRDVSLQECFRNFPSREAVFLKMDIEGGEYELLPEIIASLKSGQRNYSGMCIEFHEINSREKEFLHLITELQSKFRIVHLHANNCVDLVGDFPDVIEVSFAPSQMVGQERVLDLPLNGLDWPSDSSRQDYQLVFGVSARSQ